MIIKDYNLRMKNNILIQNSNLEFHKGKINHILGKNGVGKSQFAIDLYINSFNYNIGDNITLISSISNVPKDITSEDLIKVLKRKFDNNHLNYLMDLLNLNNINKNLLIGKLSDGQKQKLKLLSFFCEDKDIIILDTVNNYV